MSMQMLTVLNVPILPTAVFKLLLCSKNFLSPGGIAEAPAGRQADQETSEAHEDSSLTSVG